MKGYAWSQADNESIPDDWLGKNVDKLIEANKQQGMASGAASAFGDSAHMPDGRVWDTRGGLNRGAYDDIGRVRGISVDESGSEDARNRMLAAQRMLAARAGSAAAGEGTIANQQAGIAREEAFKAALSRMQNPASSRAAMLANASSGAKLGGSAMQAASQEAIGATGAMVSADQRAFDLEAQREAMINRALQQQEALAQQYAGAWQADKYGSAALAQQAEKMKLARDIETAQMMMQARAGARKDDDGLNWGMVPGLVGAGLSAAAMMSDARMKYGKRPL